MRCGDIINLPALRLIKLVAGAEGLDRTVRWVYAVEVLEDTLQVSNWLNGGELLFLTGVGLKQNNKLLIELIQSVEPKNIAGIVFFTGPYIKNVPENVTILANHLKFPIFELPWEVKLVEVTHDICSAIIMKEMEQRSLQNLLENIFFSNFNSYDNFMNITSLYGDHLADFYRVLIVDLDNFALFLEQTGLQDEIEIIELKGKFQKIIEDSLTRNKLKALYMPRSDSVLMLVPGNPNSDEIINKLIQDIRSSITEKLLGLTVSVGIGNCYRELQDMKKSLHEAEQALIVAKCNRDKNATCFYNSIGVYRILLDMNDQHELERIFQETLGDLIQYDKMNGTDLVRTLNVFLDEKGSLNTTSERLIIHRNTLSYRLHKIESISGFNTASAEDCFNIHLALKVGRLLGYLYS